MLLYYLMSFRFPHSVFSACYFLSLGGRNAYQCFNARLIMGYHVILEVTFW